MFSQTVEYALRAMVYLADQAPDAKTTAQIAEATRVPIAYLSKVLQGLRKVGLVRSRRGSGGGVLAGKPAGETTILEVVNAVDPIRRIATCPLGLAAHGENLCPLHRRLDDALAQTIDAFGSTTLAEILAEPTQSRPLCAGTRAERRES